MNTRLQQFLSAENISQSQFADTIGVARASVSHIMAGRNRPGFDFIERMAKRYPTLNLEWLITGKGRMYKSDSPNPGPEASQDLFGEPLQMEFADMTGIHEDLVPQTPVQPAAPPARTYKRIENCTLSKQDQQPVKQRSISKIVVFYDDGTFQEMR